MLFQDDELFVRLVWNPRDFDPKSGKLKGAAFSPRDLIPYPDEDGNPRYISMDLLQMISQSSVDWRIAKNQSDKERRKEAKFLRFVCRELRGLKLETGHAAFEILSAPLNEGDDGPEAPANLAHVGVRSTTPDPGDEALRAVKVDELRFLLLSLHEHFISILAYDDVFERPK